MWQGFKKYLILMLLFGAPYASFGQQNEGVVFNLRQNWVQYDVSAKSFMPVVSLIKGNTVSFQVDGIAYENQLLYIKNTKKAYLFNGSILIAELEKGSHYYKIDSLLKHTKSKKPILSIYGEKVKNNLNTYIVNRGFTPKVEITGTEINRDKAFTSFFIMASILLLAGLISIKLNSVELFSQYSNVSRVFNLTTIDELIYKGRFFVNPGIQIIAWISFSAAFIVYYFIIKLDIHFLSFGWIEYNTFGYHLFYLLSLSLAFIFFFMLRYLLIALMASVFDMSSTQNVHFAAYLRLTFYLLLVLQFIVTLDHFLLFEFSRGLFFVIIFGSLLSIIVLIGIRLSFIIKHTFVQLFLYLCATEIFLYVFVYKLVVG